MVFRKPWITWLPLLTFGLLGSGCAELSSWRDTTPKRTETVTVQRPPAPAPALCIPTSNELPATGKNRTSPDGTASITAVHHIDEPGELPPLIPASVMPAETEPAANPLANFRKLHDQAARRYADLTGYTTQLRRREVIGGRRRPEEVIQLKHRAAPFAMYLKWVGEEAYGRQLYYVRGKTDQITLLASGEKFLTAANQRIKLTPESTWIKSHNRHPLDSLGIDRLIERFGQLVDAAEKSMAATPRLRDLGVLKRPEQEEPVHAVMQLIPPRIETLLPKGGQRLWFFDTATHLPVLIITHDHNGVEVEYYCYQHLQPATFNEREFQP